MNRILMVHSFYKPTLPSGENSVVRNQAELLADSGYEVRLWGPTSPGEPSSREKLETGSKLVTNRSSDPLDEIASFKPDLIHIHNMFPNISTKWLSRTEVPMIMTLHNYRLACAIGVFVRDGKLCTDCLDSSKVPGIAHGCYMNSRIATTAVTMFQRRLKTTIDRNIQALIFPALLQKELLGNYTSGVRSEVIPNYVPPSTNADSPTPFQDRSGFLVLSRLTPEKGIEPLLEIWPSSFELVIAGDGPLRKQLEVAAKDRNVRFVGEVTPEQRDILLTKSLALILPSLTLEVDPLVVPEALSSGTPCLTLKHTTTAQLANNSLAVRTYEDKKSLWENLTSLSLQDRSHEARELYDKNWSKDKWLFSYHKFLLELQD